MQKTIRALSIAACAGALLSATGAHASAPTGLWIDHTGRGGIEITDCGNALCGKLVWLKDTRHKGACGTKILGSVKPVGKDTWDNGWIYDPDDNAKYSVELKLVAPDKLQVTGYLGSKLFSETMHWRRASGELTRCDAPAPAAAAAPLPSAPAKAEGEPVRSAAAEPAPKVEPTPDAQPQASATPAAAPPPVSADSQPRTRSPAPRTAQADRDEDEDEDEPDADEPESRSGGGQAGGQAKDWQKEIGKELGKYVSRSGKDCKVTTPFFSATFRCE